MILLQDNETCRQARLILRELIKGDKSRAQLWGSLVDNQLDDVDLRFLHPPLANEGYIEESEGMWHILDKGVKYMQTYDRIIMESLEGYLEYGDTLAEKVRKSKERKKEQESKMNNKIALWTFIVGSYLHADRSYSSPNIARHARNNIANPWQITVIWRSLMRFSKFIYSFLSIP